MNFSTIFVAPIISKDRLAVIPYKNLLQLSFAIRLLLESSAGKDIDVAETLLKKFCGSIVDVLRSDTAETINVHCLRHLAHQCRAFGPLCFFMPSFESPNRILNRCSTGTHSHCQVICRRYAGAQSFSTALPEDDMPLNLVQEWCHQEKILFSSKNFCRTFWRVSIVNMRLNRSHLLHSSHELKLEAFILIHSLSEELDPNSYIRQQRI